MQIGNWIFDRRLPKASLLAFEWWAFRPMWTIFRMANVVALHFGPLVIRIRAPYMVHAARQLHPELFH